MKVFLAATSDKSFIPNITDSKYILESFYYFQDWQIPLIKKSEMFLLDSGAFTFMSGKKSNDFDGYLTRYIKFKKNYDVKYFFELDIDSVVGYDEVKRLRERLEKETGKKCIPVWHKSRGIEEFKKIVNDYDYVAIGGIVTKEITRDEYPLLKKLCAYAKQNGTRVHGLGFTELNIAEYGFYSCDSTTWNMISRFGKIYRFTGERIVVATPKGKKIDKSKYIEGEVYNIKEWIKYQNYLRRF